MIAQSQLGLLIDDEAVELPLSLKRRLRKLCIHTCGQLLDLVEGVWHDAQLRDVFQASPNAARSLVQKVAATQRPRRSAFASTPFTFPPLGFAGAMMDCPAVHAYRHRTRRLRESVSAELRRYLEITSLPDSVDLLPYFSHSPVGDQGRLGSCVGWASTAGRDFAGQLQFSPRFAYEIAKELDGHPDVEGSWQLFALKGMCIWGHILEQRLPYTDNRDRIDIHPFLPEAERYVVENFVDLMPHEDDFYLMPDILKAVLAGGFEPHSSPNSVPVSLVLYESFFSSSATAYGIVTVPAPGEKIMGGHAMTAVGYIDAGSPANPLPQDYVILRNSWGTGWAPENVLGPAFQGHALVPTQYFANPELLREAFMLLAEVPSPPGPRRWLGRLRRNWEPQQIALVSR